MTWNSRNGIDRSRIGGKRLAYKRAMAWSWLQENKPDIAAALIEESRRKFPILDRSGSQIGKVVREGLKKALKNVEAP